MKSSNTSRPCRFQLSRSQSYILQANNADLCSHGLFSFLSFFLFFFFFSFLSFFFFFFYFFFFFFGNARKNCRRGSRSYVLHGDTQPHSLAYPRLQYKALPIATVVMVMSMLHHRILHVCKCRSIGDVHVSSTSVECWIQCPGVPSTCNA